MVTTVAPEGFPAHFEQFMAAVLRVFPVLGFTPDQIQSFIQNNREMYDDTVITIELGRGETVFSRRCDGWKIVYLIPSNWARRYVLVGKAIEQVKADYLQSNATGRLFHRIDEQAPSHSAYYAALLPQYRFELEPRVRMTAPQDVLEQVETPTLPAGLREEVFQPGRLPDIIDLYERAYSVRQSEWSALKRDRFRKENCEELTDASRRDDRIRSWITVEHNGHLIGSCFGSAFRDKLFVEELAILPEYYGRGVGRFLLVRCLQQLKEQFGTSASFFVLDTWRDADRALKLYHRLGFQPIHYYTDAAFINWAAWQSAAGEPAPVTAP